MFILYTLVNRNIGKEVFQTPLHFGSMDQSHPILNMETAPGLK